MDFVEVIAIGAVSIAAGIGVIYLFMNRGIAQEKPPGWGFDLAPVNACIWLAADGWRFKVGYEITGTLDTDWKVMSTESYDTEREARADLVKIVCTGWTIDEVEG